MKTAARYVLVTAIAAAWAYGAANQLPADGAQCGTDSECMELCAAGTWDLPPDHPDYCDGGPQS